MSSDRLSSKQHKFTDWDEAQEYYLENGLTDGLPIIPPTEEKVTAMLEYAGLAANEVIGIETVRQREFTAEKIAINAVMAGCKPEYFPVVIAAVEATCESPFNLHASTTSTNGVTIMLIVSGPYAKEIGMNHGVELMGNGTRSNATIGRAINLVKTNFYGSVAKEMDNSTFGHGGKFSFCFAENLECTPWNSLAKDKGFSDNSSTVTAVAAGSPIQISIYGDKQPETFLTQTAHGMLALGASVSEAVVVISPEIMAYIGEYGWSRPQAQQFLFEKTQRPASEWLSWKRLEHYTPSGNADELVRCFADSDRITIVPGGGDAGAFIDIISSWGSSRSVTKEIKIRS